jgi:hypothetical protein
VKPLNSTDLGDDDCSNGLAHSRNAGEQFNRGFCPGASSMLYSMALMCSFI